MKLPMGALARVLFLVGGLVVTASGAPLAVAAGMPPCADFTPERQLLFGDLHVHTKYSLDASTQGTRTSPADAYDFARGGKLGVQPWTEDGRPMREIQLSRPLDFAAVTDHAELLGETALCVDETEAAWDSWQCRVYRAMPRAAFFLFNTRSSMASRLGFCGDDGEYCRMAALSPWRDIRQAAEAANSPCEFTSFVAYEWTGAAENLANLHRNIIFRNDAVPTLPISFIDASTAPALWDALDAQCSPGSGDCEALVIPHNSNLSDGYMFRNNAEESRALGPGRVEQQARLERVVEIMQHKGSSECYFDPLQSEDELCAFEQLPYGRFSDKFLGKIWSGLSSPPRREAGYLRDVLRNGMDIARQNGGDNPQAFGFIASSDTHISAPGSVGEEDFIGHGGAGKPTGEHLPKGLPDDAEYNPGGLAAVWAEENTRDAIFDALQRREVYATSGPRIELRFFGGRELDADICQSDEFAVEGYRQGVPMGAEIMVPANPPEAMPAGPVFAVQATMDAGSASQRGLPLYKLQIVRGSVDTQGRHREKVIDVAVAALPGEVDTASCATSGEGAERLCARWQDTDFDPATRYYYYARAVENPRCRWSQQLCVAAGVDCAKPSTIASGYEACCGADHRPVIHERAWSSPIWVTPAHNER
ncbi:DUF3604 domain-containing protein [Spongiibacter sp. KMU-166]|uniref:DUF3604 domain-containing protein n=1 Tax=Spongiibacter thalassae TaxID=2721624 RepID=A0ABX1GD66_9GAMM|nr:DUF3604 domain-containing protein [Spongiibacter thalassae]NKI17117.1 DUF3604 domain-containing protein [Spongiibacter thalassae]